MVTDSGKTQWGIMQYRISEQEKHESPATHFPPVRIHIDSTNATGYVFKLLWELRSCIEENVTVFDRNLC